MDVGDVFDDFIVTDVLAPMKNHVSEVSSLSTNSAKNPKREEMTIRTQSRKMMEELDILQTVVSQEHRMYAIDEIVEAKYDVDGLFYEAKILSYEDRVNGEPFYNLIFTEYGNTQLTGESNVRKTVTSLFKIQEKEVLYKQQAKLGDQLVKCELQGGNLEEEEEEEKEENKVGMGKMSTQFEKYLKGKVKESEIVKKEDDTRNVFVEEELDPTLLENGTLSAEERKALILAEAIKFGAVPGHAKRAPIASGSPMSSEENAREKRAASLTSDERKALIFEEARRAGMLSRQMQPRRFIVLRSASESDLSKEPSSTNEGNMVSLEQDIWQRNSLLRESKYNEY